MFDYARKMKLALADTSRRVGIKAAGGVVIAVGAGFLIAALWSWMAHDLGWGSTIASLVIGVLFVAIGGGAIMMANKVRHPAPTTDDLKREVEARIQLASDAAAAKARAEATRLADMAENKVQSLIDRASYKASKVVDDAERSAYGFARNAAQTVGLTTANLNAASERVQSAREAAASGQETVRAVADSNAGSMAKLIGAFAIGATIAAKLKEFRDGDDDRGRHYG